MAESRGILFEIWPKINEDILASTKILSSRGIKSPETGHLPACSHLEGSQVFLNFTTLSLDWSRRYANSEAIFTWLGISVLLNPQRPNPLVFLLSALTL